MPIFKTMNSRGIQYCESSHSGGGALVVDGSGGVGGGVLVVDGSGGVGRGCVGS